MMKRLNKEVSCTAKKVKRRQQTVSSARNDLYELDLAIL